MERDRLRRGLAEESPVEVDVTECQCKLNTEGEKGQAGAMADI